MKNVKLLFIILLITIEDIYKTIVKLTKKDLLDIIELVGFGLVINSLYGLTSSFNLKDLIVLLIALYIALKVKHSKRI